MDVLGELKFEYPNYKTKWVWEFWVTFAVTLQVGWVIIIGLLIFSIRIPLIPTSIFLIIIFEFFVFGILLVAYDDSNSFGTAFKIYENGMISPRRTIPQYLKDEVNYIPFNQIKKIKIETYKNVPKYDYIKFEIFKNNRNLRFQYSMVGEIDGIKRLELVLKENIPEIWKNRKIILNR